MKTAEECTKCKGIQFSSRIFVNQCFTGEGEHFDECAIDLLSKIRKDYSKAKITERMHPMIWAGLATLAAGEGLYCFTKGPPDEHFVLRRLQ